jgi:parallel beta-helix repeat protein
MKKAVSGLMLTLLMTSMLALMFNIQPLKGEWTGTVYIRADGSIDPPDAPIITYDNVTYILTGKITSSADGIILERGNVIIDGNGYTLQGPALGYGKGFYWSGVNNVTVKNVNVYNFMVAIDVDLSSFNTLSGNNITNNGGGIYLEDSSDNVVSGNNIINNSEGINLLNSPNNSISGNNIRNGIGPDGSGIFLSYSSNNSIFGNNITNNSHGVSLGHCSNNSILGNNIIGITWWGISLCSSDYNSISGNNITNNLVGISLSNASNNNISGNIFVNDGLDVSYYSYGNLVIGNLVNGKPLVYLEGVSDYTITDAGQVILINCELIQVKNLNLSLTTVGIQLWNTHKTTISGNNITNNRCGIELTDSSNNGIFGNNITNNGGGIYLYESSGNSISRNNITTNNWVGVFLQHSSNNNIYHNNFINNTYQVASEDSVNV